ncbi:hypothetical protein EV127DRAFT_433984 [Xylaria flabelliformis]|nr:hypothetical protein EV127DRAFT_433984 [Xylaria flabelliformis]
MSDQGGNNDDVPEFYLPEGFLQQQQPQSEPMDYNLEAALSNAMKGSIYHHAPKNFVPHSAPHSIPPNTSAFFLTSRSRCNRKRRASYFDHPLTTFRALHINVQTTTKDYLRGAPAEEWARGLGLPIPQMFFHLRICVLLLLEFENPGLRTILRDEEFYEDFKTGLSRNNLAPDSDFVQEVMDWHPALDARLRSAGQRWLIALACHKVDFPSVMENEATMFENVRVGPNVSEDKEIDLFLGRVGCRSTGRR